MWRTHIISGHSPHLRAGNLLAIRYPFAQLSRTVIASPFLVSTFALTAILPSGRPMPLVLLCFWASLALSHILLLSATCHCCYSCLTGLHVYTESSRRQAEMPKWTEAEQAAAATAASIVVNRRCYQTFGQSATPCYTYVCNGDPSSSASPATTVDGDWVDSAGRNREMDCISPPKQKQPASVRFCQQVSCGSNSQPAS